MWSWSYDTLSARGSVLVALNWNEVDAPISWYLNDNIGKCQSNHCLDCPKVELYCFIKVFDFVISREFIMLISFQCFHRGYRNWDYWYLFAFSQNSRRWKETGLSWVPSRSIQYWSPNWKTDSIDCYVSFRKMTIGTSGSFTSGSKCARYTSNKCKNRRSSTTITWQSVIAIKSEDSEM